MKSYRDALSRHWPEYLMEACELCLFMISASLFTILLYHPYSPLAPLIPNEFCRRILMGIAMGATLVTLVYSPWGKQSGAHMNPAFTLVFLRLGKVAPWDALFYIIAQFSGGLAGMFLAAQAAPRLLAHSSVNYVATQPGPGGVWIAFLGEATISCVLLLVVLTVSNRPRLARFTGLFAGMCVALFITFEAPFSGMSMNPARTLGSAVLPHLWNGLWIYFTAPTLGMFMAAEIYRLTKGAVSCAKYHHQNDFRCIFCEYQEARRTATDLKQDDLNEAPAELKV